MKIFAGVTIVDDSVNTMLFAKRKNTLAPADKSSTTSIGLVARGPMTLLKQACGDDPGLMSRVVALLDRDADSEAAKEISDFMVGLFQQTDRLELMEYKFGARPNQVEDPTVRDLLARGTQLIKIKLKDKPAVRASLLNEISRVYLGLGSLDKSTPLLEASLRIQREHEMPAGRELADALSTLGMARYIQGRYDESRSLMKEAIEIRVNVDGPMSPETANTKLMYGLIVMESCRGDLGSWHESRKVIREAVKIQSAQAHVDPYEMAIALTGDAIASRSEGKIPRAFESLAKASMLAINATINWQTGKMNSPTSKPSRCSG